MNWPHTKLLTKQIVGGVSCPLAQAAWRNCSFRRLLARGERFNARPPWQRGPHSRTVQVPALRCSHLVRCRLACLSVCLDPTCARMLQQVQA